MSHRKKRDGAGWGGAEQICHSDISVAGGRGRRCRCGLEGTCGRPSLLTLVDFWSEFTLSGGYTLGLVLRVVLVWGLAWVVAPVPSIKVYLFPCIGFARGFMGPNHFFPFISACVFPLSLVYSICTYFIYVIII